MAAPKPGHRRVLAAPIGLALTVSLAFLPGTASAAPQNVALQTSDGPQLSYVVNTKADAATIERVKKAAATAGGTIVVAYEKIGVLVVHSANTNFPQQMRTIKGVQSAGATRTAPLQAAVTTEIGAPEYLAGSPAATATDVPGAEPLEADQWDLRAIGADRAAKINPGSSNVTVAVIDTGVDDTHPDLAPNFSKSQSANCVGGVADTSEGAWRPYDPASDYHGTHVAGSIAAARNGIGISGVAPGVKISAIKVSDPETSLFYPESVVCAFMFAADHGVEITNNSYYIDPWLYNCLDDPDQKAIVDAVNRASLYAQSKGTLHVASAGNANHNLAAASITDDTSPDDTAPVVRTINPRECWDIPAQLPGIVTVSATGVQNIKSYYSNYGRNVVDVAAPGGDKYQIPDTPSKNGRILSTMPNNGYAFLQGTSMAGPHAAGVAALLKSTHPAATPEMLQELLKEQADNPGCPTGLYDPDGNGVADSVCEGPKPVNGFYGFGIVNALDAVTAP
ncbi:S8 family serine peptidase [Streptomyces sp. NPDC053431]|uniref:S8 family serine peptidase n=1 Tax=Streptomyces sp. NPDC053431 TaxID=3365703 RepID=UPI0037D8BC95